MQVQLTSTSMCSSPACWARVIKMIDHRQKEKRESLMRPSGKGGVERVEQCSASSIRLDELDLGCKIKS